MQDHIPDFERFTRLLDSREPPGGGLPFLRRQER